MDEPRLKAKLRVQAMLRQAQFRGVFGAVLRAGDADAGGIVVVLRARDGLCALSEARDGAGRAGWMRGTSEALTDQAGVDAYVARRLRVDPDLWVVEFEAPVDGLPFEGARF